MFRKRKPPAGSPAGEFTIDEQALPTRVSAIAYSAQRLEEKQLSSIEELDPFYRSGLTVWVDVQGLGSEEWLRKLGEGFSIHPLALADIVNIPQRPKTERYADNLFVVTRMARMVEDGEVDIEQLSLIIGEDHVVTFQERYGDVFEPVRNRLRQSGTLLRRSDQDYLAYALLDAVIDEYYPILEDLGDDIAELEEDALEARSKSTLREINGVRRNVVKLIRSARPQREALLTLMRDPNPLIGETVRLHLRDCLDHVLQVGEVLESYREIVASLTSTYLSSMSNRTNDVMKVLTVMSTIFIPLTFLVGVYGMNFDAMPELHWRWSYPLLWVAMAAITGGLMWYFHRRGWFGEEEEE